MSIGVTFNGTDLSEHFYIGQVIRPLPDYQPQTSETSALRGSIFRSSELGSVTLTVPLAAKVTDGFTARDCLTWLTGVLDVSEPKRLTFSDEQGRYRLAVPTGSFSPNDDLGYGTVDITFLQPDPAAYGETRTATIPSGGSVTIDVGGNTYTYPALRASAVRNASSLVWGVRLDNADFIHVATGSASARSVVIDNEKRLMTVAGAVSLPTLDSDWLALTPATHTLANDQGTGATTVTWIERWL